MQVCYYYAYYHLTFYYCIIIISFYSASIIHKMRLHQDLFFSMALTAHSGPRPLFSSVIFFHRQ
jgi:hypothetical protein